MGKRTFYFGALIVFITMTFLLSSCKNEKSDILELPQFVDTLNIHEGLDIVPENDYSHITAKPEFETYDIGTEKVRITVQNENPGKGFYMYFLPYLQFKDGDVWRNVKYSNPEITDWSFVGKENNTTEKNYTYVYIHTKYIENLKTGEYRVTYALKDGEVSTVFTFK
ncbi:MAG TPA: hypothetical protein VFC76_07165 [Oscillospiraceae bacterium]|nr:hypothetical protein [Oscillospiraceae bacterium]